MSDAGKREFERQVERGDHGPEMQSIARGNYGSIARQVDVAMAISSRPCRGGECDEPGAPQCRRHENIPGTVTRYLRYCDAVRGGP